MGDGFVLLGSGLGPITALDVTAKGSLLVGDGTTDPVALAVGANNYVLTADSTQASGVKWAQNTGIQDGYSPIAIEVITDSSNGDQYLGAHILLVLDEYASSAEEELVGFLFDENGYFYFSTRDDDVIIMAGYRIGPFEVESALSTHKAVAECAVIATPDKVRGEVIEAFVVLMPGTNKSNQLTEELQKWVKTNFAAHAYPRHITYVEKLPKTPSGKIQRFVLREQRKSEISRELNNGSVCSPCEHTIVG